MNQSFQYLGCLVALPSQPIKRIEPSKQKIENLLFGAIRIASDNMRGRDMEMEHHYQKILSYLILPADRLTYLVRVSNIGPTGTPVGHESLNMTMLGCVKEMAASAGYDIVEKGDPGYEGLYNADIIERYVPDALYIPDVPSCRTIAIVHRIF